MATKRKNKPTSALTKQAPNQAHKHDKLAPDWQVVENVVAACEQIQARVPGVTVTQRAQVATWWDETVRRDVDALVEAQIGARRIRIGIEVKNRTEPLDIADMGQIVDLARDVQLDHYCVVSASGYSKDAEKKAKQEGIELMTIEEFEASDFWVSPPGNIVFESGPEPVHVKINYATREEYESLVDLAHLAGKPQDVILERPSGEMVPLPAVLIDSGRKLIEQSGRQLLDQELFAGVILLPSDQWQRMHVHGHELPIPDHLEVVYRYIHRPLPEYRFRVKGLDLLTVEMKLFGETRHVTMAAIPHPEGGSRIAISHVRAKPKKVKIER